MNKNPILQSSKSSIFSENKFKDNRKACIQILRKDHRERSHQEIFDLEKIVEKIPFLYQAFIESGSYEDTLKACCNYLKIENASEGEIIFNIGDKGDKFYLILEGEVSIYLPKSEQDLLKEFKDLEIMAKVLFSEANEQFKALPKVDAIKKQALLLLSNSELYAMKALNHHSIDNIDERVEYMIKDYFIKKEGHEIMETFYNCKNSHLYSNCGYFRYKNIKNLKAGEYFGEIALSLNKRRAATLISKKDTTMATLSKKDYAKIFEKVNDRLLNKLDFFSNLLGTASKDSKLKCTYEFREKKFKNGEFLFKETSKASKAFIIFKGNIRIMKDLSRTDKRRKTERTAEDLHRKYIDNTVSVSIS